MIVSTTNPQYTNLMHLAYDLVSQLIAGGFKLELCQNYSERVGNRYTATTPGSDAIMNRDSTGLYVLSPTADVDPMYLAQPWRLVIRVDNYYLNFWATTTKGYYFDSGTGAFSFTGVAEHHSIDLDKEFSGIYSYGSLSSKSCFDPEAVGTTFFNAKSQYTLWPAFGDDMSRENLHEYPTLKDNPLTFKLTLGTQGIAFAMWPTNTTSIGYNQAWFVIQRATDYTGNFDPTVGYSALKCVYSLDGGGDTPEGNINPMGILQFEVRERDCQLPTMPYSAVLPTYKKRALINPRKQVCNDEATGMPRLLFMEQPSSNRFISDGLLDLVAYGDATSSMQGEEYQIDVFGDGNLRTYEALGANLPNQEGMRLFLVTDGEDVNYTAPQNLAIEFKTDFQTPYGYKDTLLHLNTARSVSLDHGYLETSIKDFKFGLRYKSGDFSLIKRFLVGNDPSNLKDISYAAIPAMQHSLDLWLELDVPSGDSLETIVIETYNLDTGDAYDEWTINIAPWNAEDENVNPDPDPDLDPDPELDNDPETGIGKDNNDLTGTPNTVGFNVNTNVVQTYMNGVQIVAMILNYGDSGAVEDVAADREFDLVERSDKSLYQGPIVGNSAIGGARGNYIPAGSYRTSLWIAIDNTYPDEHTLVFDLYEKGSDELLDTLHVIIGRTP